MQFSLHLDKKKAADMRGMSKESHGEVVVHVMACMGSRTPGHVGEQTTNWKESETLPWKQTVQLCEAYFSLAIGMFQLI